VAKLRQMKAECDICGTEIDVQMCCSGYMCGCQGMPTEPPVCSSECYDKYMKKIHGEGWKEPEPPDIDGLLDMCGG